MLGYFYDEVANKVDKMFSFEYSEIFYNTYFEERLQTAASVMALAVVRPTANALSEKLLNFKVHLFQVTSLKFI